MTDVQVWGMTRQVASLKSSWPVISICSVEGKIVNILDFASPYVRRRQWHPTPVLLPGKSDGRRSLEGCSPWGRWKLDTTERLPFHFSLSCIGEGNGNPLQCSCLENPRDGGTWWAAIYGVSQSQTRLKRLSCSSNLNLRGLVPIGTKNFFIITYRITRWWWTLSFVMSFKYYHPE